MKIQTKTSRWLPALCALAVTWSTSAAAQTEAEAEARRILQEAQAHDAEGRPAMAAQRYLELYDVMRGAELPRAPIALFSAGLALSQLPGREREAIDTLQRFLDESTTLTDDAEVRDWRSEAVTLIDELEARAAPAEEEVEGPEESDTPAEAAEPVEPADEGGGGISPIGPVLLGVGGAAVVAGIIMGAVAFSQGQDLLDRCPTEMDCPGDLRDDEDTARTLAIAGDVTWIGGAIVAATGLVLTLVLTGDGDGGERAELRFESTPGGGVAALRGGF